MKDEKKSGRGRSIIKAMSIRARSQSKNRSDSYTEKKPEEKVEDVKSKSGFIIRDEFGGYKLTSPKLLKKSSKKVDTTPLADDENKSTKNTRSLKSLLSRRSNKTSESAADGPSTSPEEAEARAEDTDAGEAAAEEADSEACALSPIEDTGAGEEAGQEVSSVISGKHSESVTPSVTESDARSIFGNTFGQCFGLAELPETDESTMNELIDDVTIDNVSVSPSIAESIAKITLTTLRSTYLYGPYLYGHKETEDESVEDVLKEGLPPTEVKAFLSPVEESS
mmetsp:Transcript_22968/g.52726  ORF Transcript_22968/g.52726 Transcript_22968/m.52726 type:complete len:281 (-) Transcript_22968:216-1058(-)